MLRAYEITVRVNLPDDEAAYDFANRLEDMLLPRAPIVALKREETMRVWREIERPKSHSRWWVER